VIGQRPTRWQVPYSRVSNRLGEAELAAVAAVFESDTVSRGEVAAEFERAFAARVGAPHAVATSSGTAALFLAAQVLGLGPGDEVVTTPQTFWVTAWPFLARGCTVRFADVDPVTLGIDPAAVEALLTPRTRAVVVVHHGGHPVDLQPILDLAAGRGVAVVEDAAHAPGATYRGRPVGSLGDLGCFSFNSLKNLTTGEGGMLVTRHRELAERAAALGEAHVRSRVVPRPEPRLGRYAEPAYYPDWHAQGAFRRDAAAPVEFGQNYRLGDVAAAIGLVQLAKLDRLTERRRALAGRLDAGLAAVPGVVPQGERPDVRHARHLYTAFVDGLDQHAHDRLVEHLEWAEGVEIALRYFPVHLLPELRLAGSRPGDCPVAEEAYFTRQLQLPIYDHLTDDQVEHMVAAVGRAVRQVRR
jgi:dTDP-4-amino-4,6-dideoxygalactose transaminase